MKRWPIVLLVLSLVLNIFLLGMIGGGIWRWTHGHEMGPREGWRMRAADALPEPQASAFRSTIKDTLKASSATIQQARAARAEAARLFVAPHYDPAGVSAALDRAHAADTIIRTSVEHRMIAFAATLPQDQRQKLADALKGGPFRQGRPH